MHMHTNIGYLLCTCTLTLDICVRGMYPVWQDLTMVWGRQSALNPPISSSLTVELQAQQTSAHTLARKHKVSLHKRESERETFAERCIASKAHTCIYYNSSSTLVTFSPDIL